jgi:hypothetical protein
MLDTLLAGRRCLNRTFWGALVHSDCGGVGVRETMRKFPNQASRGTSHGRQCLEERTDEHSPT